jgi:uncharacterized protein (TIGR00297 family)
LRHERNAGRQLIDDVIGRAVPGLLLASAIALAAGRLRLLSPSGVIAAIAAGTACAAAGWSWALMLIAFFVVSSGLTRFGARRKRVVEGIVQKGGRRDAVQVLANGGLFAFAALMSLLHVSSVWTAVGAGALAAAAADTWATEIGTLAEGAPRSITTGRPLPTGTSGGVTLLGSAGGLAGAAFVGLLAWMSGWPAGTIAGAVAGGIAGTTADSLLGATVQARRWCEGCAVATERVLHMCGRKTEPAGGFQWLDNDGVNLAATLAGATVALVVAAMLGAR